MNMVYVFAAGSFVLGAFGYVIFYFWLRPIIRYRSVKRHIITDMTTFLNTIYNENEDPAAETGIQKRIEAVRRHSVALTDCYDTALPDWYRLLLQSRGESPLDAAKHLLGLSNTRNYEHAKNRIDKIRQTLNIH